MMHRKIAGLLMVKY